MNVMIIPAAGRGTRLSFDGPKLLYPLAGKPLITHLIERYKSYIDLFVIVVNPDAKEDVRKEIDKSCVDFLIDFQLEATGMLDAITMPMDTLQSQQDEIANVWISWCDQASITAETASKVDKELSKLARRSNTYLTLPTAQVVSPYIHMQRDQYGNIDKVLQRRENDEMPEIGENDCGLFAMSGKAYFHELREFAAIDQTMGLETKERNFLPFIAWLSQKRGRKESHTKNASKHQKTVTTLPATDSIETLGINTVDDAQALLKAWL